MLSRCIVNGTTSLITFIYLREAACGGGKPQLWGGEEKKFRLLLSVSTLLQESHLARSWGLSNLHKHKTHRKVQRCKKQQTQQTCLCYLFLQLVLIFGKSTCITIKDGLKDELWSCGFDELARLQTDLINPPINGNVSAKLQHISAW